MKLLFTPSKAKGKFTAPPSKSETHRLLICAALSESESTVHGISLSNDISATLNGITALGAQYFVNNDTVTIKGIDASRRKSKAVIDCGDSASTLRFLMPVFLLTNKEATFKGSEALLSRPFSVYENILLNQKIHYKKTQNEIFVCGKLNPDSFKIEGNISSQFISGLLFALPLLEKDSIIDIISPVESKPYIDLTIASLSKAGIKTVYEKENRILISGNQKYSPFEATVEGDYSNSAYIESFGENVIAAGLNRSSCQGDKIYPELFEKIRNGFVNADLSDVPDLAPVLFALAILNEGAEFSGIKRLKYKESSRSEVMKEEVRKLGADIVLTENTAIIKKTELHSPVSPLSSHNDHRIAMALSLLLSVTGGTLEGAQTVEKSFPDFFNVLCSLGITITEIQ